MGTTSGLGNEYLRAIQEALVTARRAEDKADTALREFTIMKRRFEWIQIHARDVWDAADRSCTTVDRMQGIR